MIYPLLALTIVLNASAQLILKKGANVTEMPGRFGSEWFHSFVLNPYILSGIVLYGLSFFIYFRLLKELDLSFASPVVMASAFILVYIFSASLLGETITLYKVAGLALIISGLIVMFAGR